MSTSKRRRILSSQFEGRTAIVTGAARGVGLGIATMLASEGATTFLVDQNEEVGKRAAGDLAASGLKAFAVTADVSQAEDMRAVAALALERTGRIDIVCPNAAIFGGAPIAEMPEAVWDRLIAVNLKGVFLSVQACLPAMIEAHYGRIVITSSITGPRTAIAGMAHYAASKGGINGFIRAAALELAPLGITVNGVEPGHVLTEGSAGVYDEYSKAAVEKFIPIGRFALPADIAGPVLFLAGDNAGYVTGQTIVADGGVTIPEYPPGVP
jgi:3-oxoacyl-[acyl-carrier protein] reductase